MDLPLELREQCEELLFGRKQAPLAKVAKTLTDRYTNQSGRSVGLIESDDEALVYSIVRMPATYGAVYAAIAETMQRLDAEIETVGDFGAGTGSATWAVQEYFGNVSVHCYERSKSMQAIGKAVMQGTSIQPNVEWRTFDVITDPIVQQYDLVVASYMLNELTPTDRSRVLAKLWQATKQVLIIIEPGTTVAFEQIRSHRKAIESAGGWVVAPCPNGSCPIKAGDWCHFSTRIARSKAHRLIKGDAPFEDEKFCYLSMAKLPATQAKMRVLRHPYVEKSQIRLTLCDGERIFEQTVRKGDARYKKAQKAKCGDEF